MKLVSTWRILTWYLILFSMCLQKSPAVYRAAQMLNSMWLFKMLKASLTISTLKEYPQSVTRKLEPSVSNIITLPSQQKTRRKKLIKYYHLSSPLLLLLLTLTTFVVKCRESNFLQAVLLWFQISTVVQPYHSSGKANWHVLKPPPSLVRVKKFHIVILKVSLPEPPRWPVF